MSDPFEKAESGEGGGGEEDRFGASTGMRKSDGGGSSLPTPSMPGLLDSTKQSPFLLKGCLFVGVFLAFTTMCILSVIVSRMRARSPYPNLCVSHDCLEEAAIVLDYVNRSVDPCDDFYSYACGNFPTMHPADSFWDIKDAWSLLDDFNEKALEDTLASGIRNPNSAEGKAKTFYTDCTNEYLKTDLGGKPLIDAVNSLGGWYALNTNYNSKQWGTAQVINAALQNVHALYAVAPFFTIQVNPDYDHRPSGAPPQTWTIEFNIPQLALYDSFEYLTPNDPAAKRHLTYYKNFISQILHLLWRDSGFLPPQSNIVLQNTVNDIVEMETDIANITWGTAPSYDKDVYKPISYLSSTYPGLVDWTNLVQRYFPKAGLTDSTIVRLHEEQYLGLIANWITKLQQNDPNGARKINNYIMWCIARQYATDLGWEYVHANRDWAMAKYDGYVYFTGQQKWCVIEMERHLQYLLSGIYIADHFQAQSLQKASDAYDYINQAYQNRIGSYDWMDSSAKAEAKLKLQKMKKKIGYPSWLGDVAQINDYYSQLSITRGSTFANIVQVTAFDRAEDEKRLLQGKVDPGRWPTGIYKGDISLQMSYNALYIPAGFLQRPFFDGKVPQYMNFASIGRFAGGYMTGDIDYWGCNYDENGFKKKWWPDSTLKAFNANIKTCQNNLYVNQSWDTGYSAQSPMPHPLTFGQVSWRDIAALNVAYTAYRSYVSDKGAEMGLPGFQSESTDQAFFTAFAQTWCQSADPLLTWYYYSWWYQPIPQLLINTIMRQMPQFRQAFQCPASKPLGVPINSCKGF